MAAVTEITVTGGLRYRVEGDPREIEAAIVAASRGSVMELVWLTEAQSGEAIALNPEHVVALR